jgi:hypothetical protein
MDYTIYLWHIATHHFAFLWRFHLVHHVDLDLDMTTALRFQAADMALSTPYPAVQVALIGVSPRALSVWQGWFFLSVLFHHSNLRLPERMERILALALTTPRMHGIHHSTVREETDPNWSSGFSFWDRLHGTFRNDVPQAEIAIGVPGYPDPAEIRLARARARMGVGARELGPGGRAISSGGVLERVDTCPGRKRQRFGEATDLKALHHVCAMHLNRSETDSDTLRQLLVGQAGNQSAQHFVLTRAQGCNARFSRAPSLGHFGAVLQERE